jgi:hypothetical protein
MWFPQRDFAQALRNSRIFSWTSRDTWRKTVFEAIANEAVNLPLEEMLRNFRQYA